jgi:hypothetical protein
LVRELVSVIDWDCQVKQIYHTKNIGCKENIFTGIETALQEFEKIIIIEDDILISESFIGFCSIMLEKFAQSENIYSIGGFNGLLEDSMPGYDGYFSKRHNIWGWATWRRAWKNFRSTSIEDSVEMHQIINQYFDNKFPANLYLHVYDDKKFRNENWEVLWDLYLIFNDGYSISSTKNIVKNIGFDEEANRTKYKDIRGTFPIFEFDKNQAKFNIKEKYDNLSQIGDEANFLLRIICTYTEPRTIFMYYKNWVILNDNKEGWKIQLEPFFKATISIDLLIHLEKYHPLPEFKTLIKIFEKAKKLHEN